ncbi:MAG: DNA alkylation repair protein [Peptostreptococcus porci]|uniref:DNA alkylation repair protein n=1 Tax=Peptostreptococcus porci TaxID=2652282 RepID=A0A6N7XGT9_9FIRM|nr:DNA alkylation repair protein [Peptostreptococcus porci]MDY5479953.1 DNA alkylation repair protein [Peptostreptococcus porci]MST62604.1 DNA alkylation repair protein [Peptostreptococcus porci]
MNLISREIQTRLFDLQDLGYRDFNAKLIPNIDKEKIIGVRSPELKKLAKEFSKREDIDEFLQDLPHQYYEENNLHCFILSTVKDFDYLIKMTEEILPYIDNWATCDSFSPPIFKKYPREVYKKIKEWIKSDKTYTKRYGIVRLMNNYLDDEFLPEMLELVSSIKSDEYYINMAIAWYFSFALIKQYDHTIGLIEGKTMDKFVHNKSIQKAVESRRIDDDTKEYLKTLKK